MTQAAGRSAPPWLGPLVFAVTAAAYVLTAAPSVHWLDSGELAGAAATLGVAHPPGHPVFVLAGHAATWLPFGSVGFRASLLSSLMAGLAAALTALVGYHAARAAQAPGETPQPDGSRGPSPAVFAGLTAGLVSGLATGWWLQAVRPEVYSLHVALVLAATLALVRWRAATAPAALGQAPARAPAPNERAGLLAAAALVGLAAGNHHYLLLFYLPALVALVWGRWGALGRSLPGAVAIALAALMAYALLPLRAAHAPAFDFGAPDTWQRLLDVITARVFQSSVGAPGADIGANLQVAARLLLRWVGASALLAPLGLALLVRRQPRGPGRAGSAAERRTLGVALALGLVGNLATKVLMALDPANPDAAGYFATSVALTAALAAPAVAWIVTTVSTRLARLLGNPRLTATATGVGVTLALATGALARLDLGRVNLAADASPALVDAALTRRMLPGAVALPSHYALHFNRLYQRTVGGVRPDILAVQQGFGGNVAGGRPLAARLRVARPALGPALDAFLESGRWPQRQLLALGRTTPLYTEPTLQALFPPRALRYEGGYLRVASPSATRPASAGPPGGPVGDQRADQRTLSAALDGVVRRDPELRKTLLLLWLSLAANELRGGPPEAAWAALDFADWLSPSNPYSARLRPVAGALREAATRGDRATIRRLHAQLAGADMTRLFE